MRHTSAYDRFPTDHGYDLRRDQPDRNLHLYTMLFESTWLMQMLLCYSSSDTLSRALADADNSVSRMDSPPIEWPVKRRSFSECHARACMAVDVRGACDTDGRGRTRTRSRDRPSMTGSAPIAGMDSFKPFISDRESERLRKVTSRGHMAGTACAVDPDTELPRMLIPFKLRERV